MFASNWRVKTCENCIGQRNITQFSYYKGTKLIKFRISSLGLYAEVFAHHATDQYGNPASLETHRKLGFDSVILFRLELPQKVQEIVA
jgi:hypothetical protein